MSLLSICQAAADEAGLARPTSVVGNSSNTARQLLRFAIRTGRELVKESHPYLVKVGTLTTVASQQAYDFEDDLSITDFDHFVPWTHWNQSDSRRLIPVSADEWQEYQSGLATVSINTRYRLRGKDRKIYLHETPSAVETIQFEYVSKNYCQSAASAEQSVWTADTDTGILDEELFELGTLWRMLRRLGLAYADERADYERMKQQDLSRTRTPRILRADGYRDSISNIKDANWPAGGL